ncbi:hypothetical protein BGZ76_000659 [Entomortierella beljakovae]|nr:hypothetical protein BGZ76_000659 [Entomortierella beljakovae]
MIAAKSKKAKAKITVVESPLVSMDSIDRHSAPSSAEDVVHIQSQQHNTKKIKELNTDYNSEEKVPDDSTADHINPTNSSDKRSRKNTQLEKDDSQQEESQKTSHQSPVPKQTRGQNQKLDIDQETASEDTEGEEQQTQLRRPVRESQFQKEKLQVELEASQNTHRRPHREEDSLAKTLIDSTLIRSMQDLGLQQIEHVPEHCVVSHVSEASIQEPIITTESALVAGNNLHVEHSHHEHKQNEGPRQPQQSISHIGQSNNDRGYALEKSQSNPPEVVSKEDDHPKTHKSSASIHESQNLSESSSRPKHRALAKTSPPPKRMSMLLDPRGSTTSLPSLTKVTTHTVMAINPMQTAVAGTSSPLATTTSTTTTTTTAVASENANSRSPGHKISSPTTSQSSPAVELVSKFLSSGGATMVSGQEDDNNQLNGSPTNRRNLKGGYDRSNATSPQHRTGFTSKFYPVSPSHPQLSSSAPKSTIVSSSNHLSPPTIVTTSSSDEQLQISETGAAAMTSAFSNASAIAAAAVAQSNLAGNGSKTGTLSRTQQKLWLQRENTQDVDEDEMVRRGRTQKEMDRINREYKCVRSTLDPSVESILRCLARSGKSPLQFQQQQKEKSQLQSASQTQSHQQQSHPSLNQRRSLQQLNGQYQAHAQHGNPQHQQYQQGGGTVGRDSGKMTLRQVQQMQQLHHQQQQQQQQQQQRQQQQQYRQAHQG